MKVLATDEEEWLRLEYEDYAPDAAACNAAIGSWCLVYSPPPPGGKRRLTGPAAAAPLALPAPALPALRGPTPNRETRLVVRGQTPDKPQAVTPPAARPRGKAPKPAAATSGSARTQRAAKPAAKPAAKSPKVTSLVGKMSPAERRAVWKQLQKEMASDGSESELEG